MVSRKNMFSCSAVFTGSPFAGFAADRINAPCSDSAKAVVKKKEIAIKAVADYGVDIAPRLTVKKVTAPPTRSAGIKVADAAELVSKLKTAGVL